MDHISFEGVLAPRYDFVNLIINGENIGVMAIEEAPSKELLEHQYQYLKRNLNKGYTLKCSHGDSHSPSPTTSSISTTATTSATTTSSSTTSSAETNKLLKLRVHDLIGFCEDRHKIPCLGGVIRCEEGVTGAGIAFPTSSP